MALRSRMELTPVFHKKKGKVLVNTVDVERFLKKNKAYSLKAPETKKPEEKKTEEKGIFGKK